MGDPATYQHPLIPEDVLVDKSGLEVLLEQTSLAIPDSTSSADMKPAEKTIKEKVEEAIERVVLEDTMAVTDVGTEVSQYSSVYKSACTLLLGHPGRSLGPSVSNYSSVYKSAWTLLLGHPHSLRPSSEVSKIVTHEKCQNHTKFLTTKETVVCVLT